MILEDKFQSAMFGIYKKAKEETGYNANIFLGMITDRGGLNTAKYLINSGKPSDGYTALWELGRLDLTVEAMVVDNKLWHPLFENSEIAKATNRLREYGYDI